MKELYPIRLYPMNLQTFADGEGEGEGEAKTFSQADVDRIVGERLGREKAKYQDYEDLKELVPIIQEFGYQGSPAEIKAALRAEAEERRKQAELADLQAEAKRDGTSPELLAEIKALKAELAEIKDEKKASKAQEEAKKQAEEAWDNQVKEFGEKFPDIDLPKLVDNKKFEKFFARANPKLTLIQIYEDFVELVGGAEAEAIAKIQSNLDRSTSSGRGKGDSTGGTYGLTDRQQQLAKEAGMTYKEYAEILGQIKK